MLIKQETLFERGTRVESSRVGESRTALPRGFQSWVYDDRVSFWVVFGHSDPGSSLVVHASFSLDGCQ